jgi:DNA-binding NarL/FixJ family response regulator
MTPDISILHVDDEPGVTEVVTAFLERESGRVTVTTAHSVSEGLAVIEKRDIDVVISDYDMPGRNGIQFFESVREDYPDLPFIFYTGKNSREIDSESASAAVTGYIKKRRGTDQYTTLATQAVAAVDRSRTESEPELA